MSGIQFHETRAGRQLLDSTLPEIARQLAALVWAVERLEGSFGGLVDQG